MIRVVAVFVALLFAAPAVADDAGDLKQRLNLLRAHRTRLEQRLSAQGERIRRLKGHPRGVGRDFQLGAALRGSQQIVKRLNSLRDKLRGITSNLITVYRQQLQQVKDAVKRATIQARIAKLRGPRKAGTIVTNAKTNPLDSPDDVDARADLLKDSEEKVRRQMRRLERRLTRLRLRSRLRRHSRAADDSPFVEGPPRKTSQVRAKSSSLGKTNKAPADDKKNYDPRGLGPMSGGAPAPPPAGNNVGGAEKTPQSDADGALNSRAAGGGSSWSGSGEATAAATPAVGPAVTTDVVDPSLLRRLENTGLTGNVRDRIAALRAASAKLKRLAKRLSSKAKRLRKHAKSMRHRK